MGIVVADNFQYKGGKPLDARMKFSTILDMTATPASELYDGCFSYVVAEKKYYTYDSSNDVDPSLGKWREFSQGGGSSTDRNSIMSISPRFGYNAMNPIDGVHNIVLEEEE